MVLAKKLREGKKTREHSMRALEQSIAASPSKRFRTRANLPEDMPVPCRAKCRTGNIFHADYIDPATGQRHEMEMNETEARRVFHPSFIDDLRANTNYYRETKSCKLYTATRPRGALREHVLRNVIHAK